jgi:hypothetical protein
MRTLTLLIGFILIFFAATCSSSRQNDKMELTGTIEEQGITSYQYGTHLLNTRDHFYALKSDAVDLNEYLNEEVSIVAEKIPDYPVDGGPEYLLVLEVKR